MIVNQPTRSILETAPLGRAIRVKTVADIDMAAAFGLRIGSAPDTFLGGLHQLAVDRDEHELSSSRATLTRAGASLARYLRSQEFTKCRALLTP